MVRSRAMSCCGAKGCDEFFNDKVARRDAGRYRKKGLTGPARRIVDHLRGRGIAGTTVLEVGAGVGSLSLELVKAGAASAAEIELSPAYEPYALELARDAGLEDRIERRTLDFAEAADEVAPAGVVVLNKVVCCYPDYERLVGAAAERAGQSLVLTFPRDAWWTRFGVAAANFVERLRRQSFRAYVHPPEAVLAVAEARGLRRIAEHTGLIWRFAALERV
jgi:2-polyprenyl-3-methyl-5-hydroxy-6-metoxy-1,4-benzoquinol methylase